MSQSRQPKGVPVGGQFATSAHSESSVSLTDVTAEPEPHGVDYSSWTPVEVDTELARLYDEHGTAMHRFEMHWDYVARHVAGMLGQRHYGARASKEQIEETVADVRAKEAAGERPHPNDSTMLREYDNALTRLAEAAEHEKAMEPLNEEFDDRGGWTRAFLVTNSNGHVHSSMDCQQCFKPGFDNSGNWRQGTRYHWVTDLSGKTEDDVVNAAGERACTTCYPSAPKGVLSQPTTLFTPEEIDKAEARVLREEKKKAAAAAKIAKGLTEDGSEFKVGWVEMRGGFDYIDGKQVHSVRERENSESFKTETAAVQWLVRDLVWHRDQPNVMAERQPAYDAVISAIATKHGKSVDEVRADIDKKVAAKRKRDGYTD